MLDEPTSHNNPHFMQCLIYAVFLVVFASCSWNNKKISIIDDGELKAKCEVNQRNLKHGSCKLFNDQGVLLEEAFYNNGVMTGYHKKFYDDGSLLFIRTIRNGRVFGKYLEYYMNGTLSVSASKLVDTVYVGSVYYYYPSGILEFYEFWGYDGNLEYREKFDSLGSSVERSGLTLPSFTSHRIKSPLLGIENWILISAMSVRTPSLKSHTYFNMKDKEIELLNYADYSYLFIPPSMIVSDSACLVRRNYFSNSHELYSIDSICFNIGKYRDFKNRLPQDIGHDRTFRYYSGIAMAVQTPP